MITEISEARNWRYLKICYEKDSITKVRQNINNDKQQANEPNGFNQSTGADF
jgi:hypothetical protein